MLRWENFTTLRQKGEKLPISQACCTSDNEIKTVSHRPKLCAIETSRDVGIGAQGGVSVGSQTMK